MDIINKFGELQYTRSSVRAVLKREETGKDVRAGRRESLGG